MRRELARPIAAERVSSERLLASVERSLTRMPVVFLLSRSKNLPSSPANLKPALNRPMF